MNEYEEWRYVLNYPEYVVSNLGHIRSTGQRAGRPLTRTLDESNHVVVNLAAGKNDRRKYRLDRIVAASFLNAATDRAMTQGIVHIDGDPLNCRADNLRWE